MSNLVTLKSEYRCFGGTVAYYTHQSQCCNSPMNFAVYLPPQAVNQKVPILYYLSGLTCTEENFTIKGGAQRYAAEYGLILVAPDTSPRQTGIPGEDDIWDIGSGAGFYVNATLNPWKKHYQMYDYVVNELPQLITELFPVKAEKQSIFGHSMGGHGALICALKNPDKYCSVSAFAPITAPIKSPWGQKALRTYLGDDSSIYSHYDASELVRKHPLKYPILIDQGTADQFYQQQQLLPEIFQEACQESGQELILRFQEGYDHSYFMIASFMADHIRFHAQFLSN
ncbi:S-formylglutathione hydrolase [Crocosphaera sp. XPORK-15E]|uniref:S-formylglutathione hydrolase n=1 Tax=Crocosphaera sp. XPORK-15E TaxID=3110247 RepID=UPI002B21DDF3|nr:S-formylglutathione hydrolase [Crocosphaera sp. XPORK-15E]MEA5532929.1 S-formylglutathione hydrolase [Crocosphaera sp. XPORK-15E]